MTTDRMNPRDIINAAGRDLLLLWLMMDSLRWCVLNCAVRACYFASGLVFFDPPCVQFFCSIWTFVFVTYSQTTNGVFRQASWKNTARILYTN
jgi:hypothetical protein